MEGNSVMAAGPEVNSDTRFNFSNGITLSTSAPYLFNTAFLINYNMT